MAWDALRFCQENGVQFWLTGKNVRPGWVHIRCPLCGDHSNHGGFDPEDGSYACWRCKGSHPVALIARLLHIPRTEAEKVWGEYDGGVAMRRALNKEEGPERPTSITLPGEPLRGPHREYLMSRGFRPTKLIESHGLLGTGPATQWEGADFRLRIIIPIYDQTGRLVNFQGRDITGKQELRYKGCPVEKAVVHHKHLLYGAHKAVGARRIIVVEGVFDQWRIGDGAVCTFGTSLTQHQVHALSQWPEIIFLFDPEPEAQARAREYAVQLAALGRSVELANADFGLGPDGKARDPGDLLPSEAEELKRGLLK
jgi:hypothetical protein